MAPSSKSPTTIGILLFLLIGSFTAVQVSAQAPSEPDENNAAANVIETLDDSDAEESTDEIGEPNAKFRVLLRLNEESLGSLSKTGYARASIPAKNVGKVASIKLVAPNTFKSDVAEITPPANVESNVLTVELTPAQIERIQFQPIFFKVPAASKFENIQLKQLEDSDSDEASNANEKNFYVRKSKSTGVSATLKQSVIKVDSVLGPLEFPLDMVAAIFLNNSSKGLIYLKNGDKVSGEISHDQFELSTDWGDLQLTIDEVYSITPSSLDRFLPIQSANKTQFLYYQMSKSGNTTVGY